MGAPPGTRRCRRADLTVPARSALTDPDVPPLPPHITLEQAHAFAATLLKGDPHQKGIIKQSIENLFPRKK